ncbi:MAG: DUF2927 domain-containing protein [Pseudomonadota bacterium]
MQRSLPRVLFTLAMLAVAACAPRSEPFKTTTRPIDASFASAIPAGTTAYSNDSLADVFTILTHDMEWGASRPNLVRFEGPVRVAMVGKGSNRYQVFLAEYLRRLRNEARIDVNVSAPKDANLLVRFVPGQEFSGRTNAQCIVVNGHPSWSALQEDAAAHGADAFERNKTLEKASAIIPNTIEPYKIRECILEEVSQALGTANDLYALGSSIFNDDDGHTWPTRLDYLMLRVLYDPRLETGLDRRETTARAREVLDDLNPDGERTDAPRLPLIRQQTFLNWRNRLHRLIGNRDLADSERLKSAEKLLSDARKIAPYSGYHCEAAILESYIVLGMESDRMLKQIANATDICTRVHGTDDIRVAQLRLLKVRALVKEDRYLEALHNSDGLAEIFLAYGKEEDLLTTYAQRMVAHAKLDNIPERDKMLGKLQAWGAFSLGADNSIIEELRGY